MATKIRRQIRHFCNRSIRLISGVSRMLKLSFSSCTMIVLPEGEREMKSRCFTTKTRPSLM